MAKPKGLSKSTKGYKPHSTPATGREVVKQVRKARKAVRFADPAVQQLARAGFADVTGRNLTSAQAAKLTKRALSHPSKNSRVKVSSKSLTKDAHRQGVAKMSADQRVEHIAECSYCQSSFTQTNNKSLPRDPSDYGGEHPPTDLSRRRVGAP